MMAFTMRRKPRSLATVSSVHYRLVFGPLKRSTFNIQAFIRRASSMADKTSWTKPLARMAYGDCIAGGRQLKGGSRGQRPVGAPPTGGDRGAGRGGGGRWQGGGARWAAGGGG